MQNNEFNLREYLFKDRPGEETGQRAEAIITLGLGFISTALALLAYRNPIVIIASVITNATAVFSLLQVIRGRFNYLILFPWVTSVGLCLVTILEGECEVWVGGQTFQMKGGDTIIFPANAPHALSAITRFKMSLTMIRE